jgi:adenosylcobinamide kinase/adenosylcobinamide-phosphate guanylyltransferase
MTETNGQARVTLVTGGACSGKSRYATQLGVELGPKRVYVATGRARDREMSARIADLRAERGTAWRTVEESLDVTRALGRVGDDTSCVVVDCLALWVDTMLRRKGEKTARARVQALVQTLPILQFPVILVTAELGMAVLPADRRARRVRDLVGWTNQQVAAVADAVVFMVAGIPVPVRGQTG